MTNEMPVPTHSTNQVDPLAERYRAAFDKTERTRKQFEVARSEWIEATIELGAVILEARRAYPDTHKYSAWLVRNNLRIMTPSEITAHAGFARDPEAGRKLLQASTSYKVRSIWEKNPKRGNTPLPGLGKGGLRRIGRGSGHRERLRAQRIPDVMQDQETRPRPLDVVRIKGLTREEVDPDFKGNAIEFAAKYGPVNIHTKDELERSKRQDALQKWLGLVAAFVNAGAALNAAPEADPATLADWLEKPGKAAKVREWHSTIRRGAECLPKPKEQIATSPDLLTDECPDRHSLND